MEEQLLFIYFFLDIFVSYIVSIIFIVNLTKSVNMCVVVNTGERLASASLALHHTDSSGIKYQSYQPMMLLHF